MGEYAEALNVVGPSGQMADVASGAAKVRLRSRFQAALLKGDAYSWSTLTFDPDAHDTVAAVENTDPDRDLFIEAIFASSDTASQIQVFEASGVTMAGTAVTGVNLNRASGRVAKAIAKADETGNNEQAGGYTKLLFRELLAANTAKRMAVEGAIVIPYGKMIGIDLTTAATGAAMTIVGWFE